MCFVPLRGTGLRVTDCYATGLHSAVSKTRVVSGGFSIARYSAAADAQYVALLTLPDLLAQPQNLAQGS